MVKRLGFRISKTLRGLSLLNVQRIGLRVRLTARLLKSWQTRLLFVRTRNRGMNSRSACQCSVSMLLSLMGRGETRRQWQVDCSSLMLTILLNLLRTFGSESVLDLGAVDGRSTLPIRLLLVVAVTNSPKHDFNRCKSATCRFLFRDTKSARDKNGTKPRKNKVKDTSPEISLVEYLCFVCKGTNLSLEKRGEIPISLIHNSFSYHCTPNVVIANGFDLKQHDLRKSGVKFCFAL